MKKLAEVLFKTSERIKQLESEVDMLTESVKAGHWSPEEPETFAEWVQWLIDEYFLEDDLRGWEDNSAMQAELVALRIGHRRMINPKAGPWDALSWHDHLARTRFRFGDHRLAKKKHDDTLEERNHARH